MIRLLFTVLFTLLILFPTSAQDQGASNPLYLAAILVDEPDAENMADLCHYYGFTESSPCDGYRVFTSSDGTELRFKLTGPENAPLITVEVNNLPSKKELPNILASIGFQPDKTPNTYIKGNRLLRRYTTCTFKGNHATITKHIGIISSPRESNPTKNHATRRKLRKSTNN